MGTTAPYGYIKDPADHNHLLIDDKVAHVVKEIFDLALKGNGVAKICRHLNKQHILRPAAYAAERGETGFERHFEGNEDKRYIWSGNSVRSILRSPIYAGNLVGYKRIAANMKSKKRPSKLPEEWEVIPNTHEGIVTQEEFDIVQQLITSRRLPQNKGGFVNIFAGVIKCVDCGCALRAMNVHRRKRPEIIDCVQYSCNNYARNGHGRRADPMEQIFSQLFYEVEKHRDTVLVTLIADRGSAPRKAGAQMLVGAEGRLVGTIGGGAVEGRSIQLSQQLLAQRRSCIREFPLHQAPERDIGMVCGGDVTAHFQFIPAEDPLWSETASRALALLNRRTAGWLVLAEDGSAPALLDRESVVSGSLPEDTAQALRTPGFSMAAGYISLPLPIGQRALLFGAGHISQALCPLLTTISFRPVVFDDRPELANTRLFPTAEQVICGDFTRISDYLTITDEDFVVIMTSGHVRDFQVEEQTLRGDFAYVGVIGSRRKTASVNQRLREAGIPQSSIDLVHTPIGTPILAVTPEEIAVSIAGEMIQVRAQRRGPTSHGCPMHG